MNLIEKIYESEKEFLEYDKPFVFYYNPEDIDEMRDFLRKTHCLDTDLSYDCVNYNIIEIFNRLGLDSNDSVCLHNIGVGTSRYNIDTLGNLSFNYSINSLDYNNDDTIKYYSSNELFDGIYGMYPGVKLTCGNNSLYYMVGSFPCLKKYDIRISDEVTLTREYSNDEVLFMYEGIDKSFVIKIRKPMSKIVKGNSYILDNELELVKYLSSLSMPNDLMEVYKNICEISLGKNINLYSEITLSECKKIDNSWKDINLLTIKNGEMDTIVRTVGDKTITCYGNNNWKYVLSSENVVLTINSGKTLRYGIEAKDDMVMDDYIDTLVKYDVNIARSEVNETKKLIKEKIQLKK